MKKHNEGYTLPLVMVVLLVLAIVAVTIMTTSMNNMLRQQKFIETMENQYAAQGEIEKAIAQLKAGGKVQVDIVPSTPELSDDKKSLTCTLVESSGDVKIECGIKISGNGEITLEDGEYIIPGSLSIEYTSYEIIKGGGAQ